MTIRWPFGIYARATITHLTSEVAWWRQAWEVERQRANLAYDRLLAEKGIGPITGPLMPDRVVVDPPADLEERLEQSRAGEIGVFQP